MDQELRMNLAAIKRGDPYAKEIVETSAHVAFYTFNYEENEWEKTDVEGAFFVYKRNAEPYHSIFINNRLNTNSLVEPITADLELQSQPPFLLYRNERSRIRGFWFYNKDELERVAELINGLVKECQKKTGQPAQPVSSGGMNKENNSVQSIQQQQLQQQLSNMIINNNHNIKKSNSNNSVPTLSNNKGGVNIFTMLSKAQEDFNNSSGGGKKISQGKNDQPPLDVMKVLQNVKQGPPPSNGSQEPPQLPSQSVMNFFASAKPTVMTAGQPPVVQPALNMQHSSKESVKVHQTPQPPLLQQMMSHPVTVEHIEKQQRAVTPQETASKQQGGHENGFQWQNQMQNKAPPTIPSNHGSLSWVSLFGQNSVPNQQSSDGGGLLSHKAPSIGNNTNSNPEPSLFKLLKDADKSSSSSSNTPSKPALMPPTMFQKPGEDKQAKDNPTTLSSLASQKLQQDSVGKMDEGSSNFLKIKLEPLTQSQLLQAISYLIKNDADFMHKLHEAYLKSFAEMVPL